MRGLSLSSPLPCRPKLLGPSKYAFAQSYCGRESRSKVTDVRALAPEKFETPAKLRNKVITERVLVPEAPRLL